MTKLFRTSSAVLFLIATLFLCGCSTIPSSAARYERAAVAPTGFVNVYIYRVGAKPSRRTPTIAIDDIDVFDPPELAYTFVRLRPGRHSVSVKWPWDSGAPDLSFSIDVDPDTPYFMKISGDFQATARTWTFESNARKVLPLTAELELTQCCRLISNTYKVPSR